MRIRHIVSQHRRDFRAVYECQHCGQRGEGDGYDDAHFHEYVIPAMKCPKCEKTAGGDYQPLTPKHLDHEVV